MNYPNERHRVAKPLTRPSTAIARISVPVKRALPLPSGYVKVMPFLADRDTSPRMEGILVPGRDKSNDLRNRIILADRSAPAWFHELTEKLSHGEGEDLQIRVNVVNVSNNGTTAYVRPYFSSEEEVRQDWKEEKLRREHFPQHFKDCFTMESVVEYIYRYVCNREDMHFIRASMFDDSAIAVGRLGVILRLTGASDLWRRRDDLFEQSADFDELTREHIRWARVHDLSGYSA